MFIALSLSLYSFSFLPLSRFLSLFNPENQRIQFEQMQTTRPNVGQKLFNFISARIFAAFCRNLIVIYVLLRLNCWHFYLHYFFFVLCDKSIFVILSMAYVVWNEMIMPCTIIDRMRDLVARPRIERESVHTNINK